MEGERIAKSMSVYFEKYRPQLLGKPKQTASILAKAVEEESGAAHSRKRSTELIKKLVPPRITDGKLVPLNLLNDYTSERIKEDEAEVDELKTMGLFVTPGVGNVIEKWEFLFRLLKSKNEDPEVEDKNSDREGIGLSRCISFDNLTPPVEDPQVLEGLSEQGFCATLNEGTEKLLLHGQNMSKTLLSSGHVHSLCHLLGSMVLAKNRLQFYSTQLSGNDDPFQKSKADMAEIVSAITTQLHEHHTLLATTVVIHESAGPDWESSQPYHEGGLTGERVSCSVQFWGYYLRGLRQDLFNSLPPTLAKRVLEKVFGESLACLTARYCQIRPSSRRLVQYRADLTAILLTSHDLLLSLCTDPGAFFVPPPGAFVRAAHAQCAMLATALAIVGCPIKVLSRGVEAATSSSNNSEIDNKLQPLEKNSPDLRLTYWLHLLLPGIYPSPVRRLPTASYVHLLSGLNAAQPSPNWTLLVRLCLSREMEFARLVMKNFGAFVPGITGDAKEFVKSMREGCGKLLCTKRCLGTADIYWPQAVGSGILHIVMQGNPEKSSLVKVLEPLLKKLSPSSWDILNASVMWNVRKPVWFQALLDLMEPYFHPIFDELLDDLESGRTWTLAHVPEAISKMNSNILDVAYLVPPSYYQACELIEALLPNDIRPVCDSVVAHLFISCIYGVINKIIPVFREWHMQREKLDFLVAVGEKLCNLDTSTEMQKLEGLTDASGNAKTEQNHSWDDNAEEFVHSVAEMVANQLLSDPNGQESLKAVYRFITYNSDWVQRALGVTPVIGGTSNAGSFVHKADEDETKPQLAPWEEKTFKEATPAEICSKIGQIKYSSLLNHPHTWDESLRYHCSSPGSRVDPNPILLLRLLERRPENPEVMRRGDDEDDPEIEADRALFTEVRQRLRRQMNERSATDR